MATIPRILSRVESLYQLYSHVEAYICDCHIHVCKWFSYVVPLACMNSPSHAIVWWVLLTYWPWGQTRSYDGKFLRNKVILLFLQINLKLIVSPFKMFQLAWLKQATFGEGYYTKQLPALMTVFRLVLARTFLSSHGCFLESEMLAYLGKNMAKLCTKFLLACKCF